MAEALVVEVKLDDGQFKSGLGNLNGQFNAGIAQVEKGILALGPLMTAAAAYFSFTAIKAFTENAMAVASSKEDAITRLNASLEGTGKYSAAASQNLQEFAKGLSETSRFGSGTIMETEALIQTIARLDEDGLKKATLSAANLAAALRIDLDTAARMVAKSAEGNITSFKRYGIVIEEGATNAETFANTLKKLSEFSGRAAADAETYSGRVEHMHHAWKGVQEAIGNIIIKSPTLAAAMDHAIESREKLAKSITSWGDGKDPLHDMVNAFIQVADVFSQYVMPVFELIFNLVKNIVYTLSTGITGITWAFVAVADAVNMAIFWLLDKTVGAATAAIGVFNKALADKINAGWSAFSTGAVTGLDTVRAAIETKFVGMANTTGDAWSNTLDFAASAKVTAAVVGLKSFEESIKPHAASAGRNIAGAMAVATNVDVGITFASVRKAMSESGTQIKVTAQDIAKSVNTFIVQGASQGFAKFGEALVKGENVFMAFGKAVIGALGQLLIQFGTMLIAIGIGLSTVPMLFGLQGPAAVVAGIAALVAGGALMALSGGGASAPATATAPASGGMPVTGGGVLLDSNTANNYEAPKARERGTGVVVNVHGNILDRRESGLEIAAILNEAFGANAVAMPGTANA